jgi:hypothetical protein
LLDTVVIFATSEDFVSVSLTIVCRPLSVSSYDRREVLVQHDKIRSGRISGLVSFTHVGRHCEY